MAPSPPPLGVCPKLLKILVGITGSVAVIKVPEILSCLIKEASAPTHCRSAGSVEIRVIATEPARHFLSPRVKQDAAYEVEGLTVPILVDADEWNPMWTSKGDPVLHIELRKWADVLVIAPLSANTLAKVALGLSDNLLTCVARAWDYRKPFIVCPAMNTFMFEQTITTEHLKKLEERGIKVIGPVEKTLACGDTGMGALAPPEKIAEGVIDAFFF